MSMCIKCGRNIGSGVCPVCGPANPLGASSGTKKKKLGLGKAFGKQMEKMGVPIKKSSKTAATNPLGQPQTTYQPTNLLSPRGAGPTQNTGNLPALPPRKPQPLFDEQSIRRFQTYFENVKNEQLIAEFWCKAISGDVVLEGSTYITPNYFAFSAPFNNEKIHVLIPFQTVLEVKRAVKDTNQMSVPSFQYIDKSDPRASCLQFYTTDYLRHQFYDCQLVADFETWYTLVTQQWRKVKPN